MPTRGFLLIHRLRCRRFLFLLFVSPHVLLLPPPSLPHTLPTRTPPFLPAHCRIQLELGDPAIIRAGDVDAPHTHPQLAWRDPSRPRVIPVCRWRSRVVSACVRVLARCRAVVYDKITRHHAPPGNMTERETHLELMWHVGVPTCASDGACLAAPTSAQRRRTHTPDRPRAAVPAVCFPLLLPAHACTS